MDAVAAEPEAGQGAAAGQAEGTEPTGVLAEAAHETEGPTGPAGPAPGGGQFAMEPVGRNDPQQPLQAGLDAAAGRSLAVLVLRLRQIEPGPGRREHAGDHRGLPQRRPPVPLSAHGHEQRPRIPPGQLLVGCAIGGQTASVDRPVEHQGP